MRSAILLLAVLVGSSAGAATFYKWTDAQGRTHFSSEPPPQNVKAERVQVGASERRNSSRRDLPEDEFRRLEAQAQRVQAPAQSAYRARRCEQARSSPTASEREIRRWCQ